MAKEESSKSGGLLSKVVRFVRHPTVNWSDLDGLDGEQESQYSKQALKEMIERKRRNDFVRKREFDQLRRLRQAELQQASRPGSAPVGVPGPAAQGSQFLSSLLSSKSSGERAVTLKKIDEIEAQMSQQWWRGKQAADATTIPMALPAGGNPAPASFRKQPPPSGQIPMLSDVVPPAIASAGDVAAFATTLPMSLAPAPQVPSVSTAPIIDPMPMARPLRPLEGRPISCRPSRPPRSLRRSPWTWCRPASWCSSTIPTWKSRPSSLPMAMWMVPSRACWS